MEKDTFDIVGIIEEITKKKTKNSDDFISFKIKENPKKDKTHFINVFQYEKDIFKESFKLGDFIKVKGFLEQGSINESVQFLKITKMYKPTPQTTEVGQISLDDDGALIPASGKAEKKIKPDWHNIHTFSWRLCLRKNQQSDEDYIKNEEILKSDDTAHVNRFIREDAWGLHIIDELRAKYSDEFSNIEANYSKSALNVLLSDKIKNETVKDKELIINKSDYTEKEKNIIYTELKKRHSEIKKTAYHFYTYHQIRRCQASEEKIKEQTTFEKKRRDAKYKEIHGQPHDFVRYLTNNIDIKHKRVIKTDVVSIIYKNLGFKDKYVSINFYKNDEKLYNIRFGIQGYYYCIDKNIQKLDKIIMIMTKADNHDEQDYTGLFIQKNDD